MEQIERQRIEMHVEVGDSVSAKDAEAWAVGTRHGVDVPSTDPTYHNNAKYYAEQAESSAEGVDASAAAAAESAAAAAEDAAAAAGAAASAATAAGSASGSAEAAAGSAEDAAESQAAAAGSATAAAGSAAGAAGSAQAAETAQDAAETAQEAAEAAQAVAQAVAAGAAQSAEAAAQSATDAATAKAGAESAQSAAAGSATAAAGSASDAASSKTAAAGSATAAAGSASAAAASQTAAAGSATAAAGSAQAAQDVLDSIPEDYSQMSADVTELKTAINTKAPAIYPTASGTLATFPDGADGMPLKSLAIALEPIQTGEGDPSPDNVRPITGHSGTVNVYRTGINIWDEQWELGRINSDGVNISSTTDIRSVNYIPVLPGTEYYVLVPATSGLRYYDKQKTYKSAQPVASSRKVTVPDGCYYLRFYTGVTTFSKDISINYPATETEYHPYTGTAYPVTIPTSAGTVYGGTLDPVKGTLIVDKIKVPINDDTKSTSALGWAEYDNANRLGFPIKTAVLHRFYIANGGEEKLLCNVGKVTRRANNTTVEAYDCCLYMGTSNMYVRYGVPKSITTADDAYAYLKSIDAYIVTPIEPPLDPITLTAQEINTLLGVNNIWSDAGDVTVEYPADTKGYVDGKSPVQDVQMNGVSVMSDGVANIPMAVMGSLGVVTCDGRGVNIGSAGALYIGTAPTNIIKTGMNTYNSITPSNQHTAVFYGLAKLAGKDMKNSSNEVGTFTDDAIGAILSMLGVADLIGNAEGATASKAYSINDYLLYKGKLYKVTSSIAQGAAIVPGTNCTQTNLIEMIGGN